MCSNAAARLALLGEAIDQLAAEAARMGDEDPERLAERLAAIWAMVADLDPGLAWRLRGYADDARPATGPGRAGRPPGPPGPRTR